MEKLLQVTSQSCHPACATLGIIFLSLVAVLLAGTIWANFVSAGRHEWTEEEKRNFDTYF